MSWRRRLVVVGVLALSPAGVGLVTEPAVGAGASRYVAPSGADTGNCRTPTAPCATVGYALSQAPTRGGTIHLAAGTFKENVFIDKSVTVIGAGQSGAGGAGEGGGIDDILGAVTISSSSISHDQARAGLGGAGGSGKTLIGGNGGPSDGNDGLTTMGNRSTAGGGIYETPAMARRRPP